MSRSRREKRKERKRVEKLICELPQELIRRHREIVEYTKTKEYEDAFASGFMRRIAAEGGKPVVWPVSHGRNSG